MCGLYEYVFRHAVISTAHTAFDSGNLQTTVQDFHHSYTEVRELRMEQLSFMQ